MIHSNKIAVLPVLVVLILSVSISYSMAACIEPPSGMVSWWPGDGTIFDYAGSNSVSLQSGATFTTGKVNQGFSFDGEDDWAHSSGPTISDLQQITIEAWVKHNSLPPDMIQRYVTVGSGIAVLRYDGSAGPNQLHFYMSIDGVLQHIRVNNALQVGIFYHIAGTYDGSVMRLYLNGTQVGTYSVTGTVDAFEGGTNLSSGGETLDGVLDEVSIYNRALGASEIQSIYNAGVDGKCKPSQTQNYYIDWVAIQYRIYEGSKPRNTLSFEMRDGLGNWISDANIVTDVKLYDPDNKAVSLSPVSFTGPFDYLYGRFDIGNASLTYNDKYLISGLEADILDPLVIGEYSLEVSTSDGQTHEKSIDFIYSFSMPIISHRTFQIHSDPSGNLYWMWDIPKELLDIADSYSIQIRPQIYAYRNNELNLMFQPQVPPQMGFLFIPQPVVQEIIDSGDKFGYRIQVRTDNNNARSYSKTLTVSDLYTIIENKKSVAVIPLY